VIVVVDDDDDDDDDNDANGGKTLSYLSIDRRLVNGRREMKDYGVRKYRPIASFASAWAKRFQ
jgi:hypothetical protein